MDIIIVWHTEFGFVYNKEIIFDKKAEEGAGQASLNLIKLADKYNAKITFAVCPEVVGVFPNGIKHEIGLHIHPGWQEFRYEKFSWFVGDKYLREHFKQSSSSTVTDSYFTSAMDNFLNFISKHKDINFKFASEIKKYPDRSYGLNIYPYLFAANKNIIKGGFGKILKQFYNTKYEK